MAVSAAAGVRVEIADPVALDWVPGLVTETAPVAVQVNEIEPANEAPSVAVMVAAHAHAVVGVPATDPVEELIANPTGRPVADQVKVAPDWESVAELVRVGMAEPVTFDWFALAVTATVSVIVHEKVAEPAEPLPSVAVKVTVKTPGVVGVPVIAPPELAMASPTGRPLAVHVRV